MREQIQAAIARLDAQGEQSKEASGWNSMCMYRGANGCVCFAGALMKDEFYTDQLEGRMVTDPVVQRALENSLENELTDVDLDLLERLQKVHDTFWRTQTETFSQAVAARRTVNQVLDQGLKDLGL